ncbi:SbcC/MukB-like Walker B domain-containing protein [Dyadobacter sp. Leaf189]|uniref:SbcC/MukB-like Walker B domain-containing protein n=1 Tax=Dyadobacter sp. Leaf189 TaxID=1736295 RepID=UPI0006F6FDB9|nr:SMC family ATPase [Dyadobacter sp. Leaf189]KQS23901.1 chromosome segregation protein SMC [Dyadobacter sp. Leaf189]
MIPKYLKLKGLYSYQSEQEIDFDPLTDSSLFGIFGAVGSGKSSILEAITYALYGDTERLNKSGDDRTYNMMNLRSDELLIDFECIAGKKGDRYRFTVRGKRNTKNFKEVKTFERRAYIWSDENWVPLPENESAEDIIGLSYDNFRRTIIIPQGRFQEFIELRDAERTRMMKELFQLEKYDLSRNVGSLSKQNDIALSNLDGQLTGLGEVTQEMITEEQKKRELVREEIRRVSAELLLQTELESLFQRLKASAEKIDLLQKQKAELELQAPGMQLREEAMRIYEICSLHFKSLFDQKRKLTADTERDEKQFLNNQLRSEALAVLIKKQKQTLSELKPRYETREELLDTAEELEKVIRILENEAAVEKRKEALTRGEDQLKSREKSIEQLRDKIAQSERENEVRKVQIADIQELSQVKSWFVSAQNLAENRQAIKKEADDLKTEIEAQQATLKAQMEHVRTAFIPGLPIETNIDVFRNAVQEYSNNNEESRKVLSVKLLKINTQLALQQYAGALEDGEPCPLCGSAHHPMVLHADQSLHADIEAVDKSTRQLEANDRAIRKVQLTVERLFNQIDQLEKQKLSIRERWLLAKKKTEEHDALFVWVKFDKNDRESFEKHFETVTQSQQVIREAEAAIKKLALQLETEIQEKSEKVEKPLQALRDEIIRLENTILTLSEQLEKVKLADFKTQPESAIVEKINALKSGYKEVTTLFEQTEKQLDALETENNVLAGSQATLQSALDSYRNDLRETQQNIDLQLARYEFDSELQVETILKNPLHIDAERKAIETFRFALESTSRDLQQLLQENTGQQYNKEQHEAAVLAKQTLTANLNAHQKEEGGLDRLVRKMEEDLARKQVLEKEKARLKLRKEHLDDLAKLFRSSGFVDYASSIYLKNLIQAANTRFHQMTHQQLHLELGEGNSFWIRDLLNGGHLRLLKTLSGGQKFQAALSLALALADHIHIRNESTHNFFFLDEGFGSLDKNALQTVFETLKSLRKENRIVGIISHVEDLQQEIQTYLRIIESEEGSRIEASWK